LFVVAQRIFGEKWYISDLEVEALYVSCIESFQAAVAHEVHELNKTANRT